MTRLELIKKIEDRKKQININIENLAKLSHLGVRTVNRFFAGDWSFVEIILGVGEIGSNVNINA